MASAFQSMHPYSPQVLLLSLKTGGVGLNLTAANPACDCEWQCFDRTTRMGQTIKEKVDIGESLAGLGSS